MLASMSKQISELSIPIHEFDICQYRYFSDTRALLAAILFSLLLILYELLSTAEYGMCDMYGCNNNLEISLIQAADRFAFLS